MITRSLIVTDRPKQKTKEQTFPKVNMANRIYMVCWDENDERKDLNFNLSTFAGFELT